MRLVQNVERDPATHMVTNVSLEIHLPPEFPDKYRSALIRSAEQCAVKKHLENPPALSVTTLAQTALAAAAVSR